VHALIPVTYDVEIGDHGMSPTWEKVSEILSHK
jgi:hypothetical protein